MPSREGHRTARTAGANNRGAQRKGDAVMAEFGAAMTGVRPKTTFLKPGVALPMTIEIGRQILRQKILHSSPGGAGGYLRRAAADSARPTTFRRAGMLDQSI